MSTNPLTMSIPADDLYTQLLALAWKDESFRQALLSQPKQAIQQAFGVEFMEGVEVEVLEETTDKLYLVLPMNLDTLAERPLMPSELGAMQAAAPWDPSGTEGDLGEPGFTEGGCSACDTFDC